MLSSSIACIRAKCTGTSNSCVWSRSRAVVVPLTRPLNHNNCHRGVSVATITGASSVSSLYNSLHHNCRPSVLCRTACTRSIITGTSTCTVTHPCNVDYNQTTRKQCTVISLIQSINSTRTLTTVAYNIANIEYGKQRFSSLSLEHIDCTITTASSRTTASPLPTENLWLSLGLSSASSIMTSQSDNDNSNSMNDIEELHRIAVTQDYSNTYIDPSTGYMVFTEIAHLKRSVCCGNQCRHCPYGWSNVIVDETIGTINRPKPKVKSGDKIRIKQLLLSYQQQSNEWKTTQLQKDLYQEQNPLNMTNNEDENTNILSTNNTTQKIKTGGRHGGAHTKKNVPYTRTGDSGTSQLLTGERRRKDDVVFNAMGDVDELCSVTGVVHAMLLEQRRRRQQEQEQVPMPVSNDNAEDDLDHGNNNIANTNDDITGEINDKTTSIVVSLHILEDWLLDIMSRLFDIGSHIAKPRKVIQDDDDDDENHNSETLFVADGIGGGFALEHITELEEWIDSMTEQIPELTSFILPTGTVVASHLHVARTVCRRAERAATSLPTNQVDPNAIKYLNRLSDFYFTAARYVNYTEIDQVEEILYRRPHRGAKQRKRDAVPLPSTSKVG